MQITRRLEFDAGHRIPNHTSLCRHLHGHRYAIEVTVSGALIAEKGSSDEGMVTDFSALKAIIHSTIVEKWDHAFLADTSDHVVIDFLNSLPNHRTVLLPSVPTVENLCQLAFDLLHLAFQKEYANRVHLHRVRLYETPNCWADVAAPSLSKPL